MQELALHISYLLRHNTCVILPGFGAFIIYVSQPSINDIESIITPSERQITFNKAITHDDGVLVKSYARRFNISYDEAKKVVLQAINKLQSLLRQNRSVCIDPIGSFTLGEEDNIIFKANDFFLNRNILGLAPVKFIKNQTSDTESNIIQSETTNNVELPAYSDDKRYYTIRIRKSVANIAASLFVVATLALTIILNPLPKNETIEKASIVTVERIIEVTTGNHAENLEKVNQDSDLMPDISEEADDIEQALQDDEKADFADDRLALPFHLIVATFESAADAEKFIASSENKDQQLYAIPSKRLVRVAVSSSDDKDELRSLLNSSQIRKSFPSSWIWVKPD